MAKEDFTNKINLMAQITGLTKEAAHACDAALSSTTLLPYLKLYALQNAQGLSFQQWYNAYQFKQEYEYLTSLANEQTVLELFASKDRFYIHASLLNKQAPFDINNWLQSAAQELNQHETKRLAQELASNQTLHHAIKNYIYEHGTLQMGQSKSMTSIKNLDPSVFLQMWLAKKHDKTKLNVALDHPEKIFALITDYLDCKHPNSTVIDIAINEYLLPKIHRELFAICYDFAVEKLLPMVEVQWREILKQQALGHEHVLIFFPHGKSGIMLLLVDKEGQVLDESTLYPHAPEYNIEHSIATIAKLLTRYPIAHIGWLVQPETKKAIQKILNLVTTRYPDINWQLHKISQSLRPLFSTAEKQAPTVELVTKAARYLQNPWQFWVNCQPQQWLDPLLRSLPKPYLNTLWRNLLQELLLIEDSNITTDLPLMNDLQPDNLESLSMQKHQKLMHLLAEKPDITQQLFKEYDTDLISRAHRLLHLKLERHKPIHHFNQHWQEKITSIPQGTRFYATITKIVSYGCFIELAEKIEGLLHISGISNNYIKDLNLIFKPGDTIVIEWLNYDAKQKRLSVRLFSEPPKLKTFFVTKKAPKQVETKPAIGPSAMELAFAKLKNKD